MHRREFIQAIAVATLLTGCDRFGGRPGKIGLALGGGGARGLAHVPMLEVLDELDLRPDYIAGTSIGAVMGVLYASGMTGRQIRALIDRLTVSDDESWLGSLFDEDVGRWWDWLDLRLGRGGLVDSDKFMAFLGEQIGVARFEQLQIPLKVVAAEFWDRQQVVFERGELAPAIQASIAIPGLFNPVRHEGRVLVDGGLVNPVPFDLLLEQCDTVIAVDVLGERTPAQDKTPGYFENLFNTIQISQTAILREKMRRRPPDIYIRPELQDIRVLEFNRVDEIYAQAVPARDELRQALRSLKRA
jgi:NTE family protein